MNLLKRFLPCLLCVASASAQSTMDEVDRLQSEPKIYPVYKINSPLEIDGRDQDQAWANIPWSDAFVDIEGLQKPKPKYNTRFKMAYDVDHLYIYAKMEEPHVWGDITKYDEIIFHNNDFEVFMKPDVHQDHYYELEINPLNTIFDLAMPKPYRFGGNALIHWDIKGLKSAVHVSGTLNDPKDIDQFWGLEIAIPFAALHSFGTGRTPKDNAHWLFNFSRVQWQHEIKDDIYKRKEQNGKLLPEDNWVWSPIGLINMHYPERWGYIQFLKQQAPPSLPKYHDIKRLGWNIHYLQQVYKKKQGKYAPQLTQLTDYDKYTAAKGQFDLTYDRTKDGSAYLLRIKDRKNNSTFTIDHAGNNTYHE